MLGATAMVITMVMDTVILKIKRRTGGQSFLREKTKIQYVIWINKLIS